MNRRTFFGRTAGVVVGAVAALVAKKLPSPPALSFHKDAFAFVSEPFDWPKELTPVHPQRYDILYGHGCVEQWAVDPASGIRIRLVNGFADPLRYVDVPVLPVSRPEFATRIKG